MPKPSLGIVPSQLTNALWYHMRGFSTGADRWPKADQIGKTFTAETAPAFRPPRTPVELPLSTPASLALDAVLMARQRNFSAPAHIVAAHMAELESGAIIPLREALQSTQDPRARQRIEQSMEFLQGRAATQLGYALRSLAASYNELASERKTNLSSVQSVDVQRVIKEHKLGFLSFFADDIAPMISRAADATQLRLTQTALSRFNTLNRGGGATEVARQTTTTVSLSRTTTPMLTKARRTRTIPTAVAEVDVAEMADVAAVEDVGDAAEEAPITSPKLKPLVKNRTVSGWIVLMPRML